MPIINTVEGDLIKLALSGRYSEIAHGANCFCVMKAGIAPQIAKAFPEAYEADQRTIKGDKNKLGKYSEGFSPVFLSSHKKQKMLSVLNLYTQYGYGNRARGLPDVDYQAIEEVFSTLDKEIKDNGGYCSDTYPYEQLMGIPMIGAGLAGGDWKIIEEIINRVTPNIDIELVIYKP